MTEAVRELQRRLEDLYEVEVPHDVREFLITDARLARILEGGKGRDCSEKLLVRQDDEETLELSLYLDADLLARFEADSPLRHLHAGNLETFCTVLEGVSHFVYLAWRAGADCPVSLLELELQAEVDKYAVGLSLAAEQHGGQVPGDLWARLFRAVRFDPRLDAGAARRYRRASEAAAGFCRALHQALLEGRAGGQRATRALRRYYRLRPAAKLAAPALV